MAGKTGKKKALGRGLDALIRENPLVIETVAAEKEAGARELPIADIVPNRYQPRQEFHDETLQELAGSIRENGVIQPIAVRPLDDGYELISGERRLKAASMAGLETIPAITMDVTDEEQLRLSLVENIQREDLDPIERAQAYRRLMDEFEFTQEELSGKVGKKRSSIANTVRLLTLPQEIQLEIKSGAVTMGHAKAILAFEHVDEQLAACRKIVSEGLSVRAAEKLTEKRKKKTVPVPAEKDVHVAAIEDELREAFGTRVNIVQRGDRGKVEIEYYNADDLERIIDLLRQRNL